MPGFREDAVHEIEVFGVKEDRLIRVVVGNIDSGTTYKNIVDFLTLSITLQLLAITFDRLIFFEFMNVLVEFVG